MIARRLLLFLLLPIICLANDGTEDIHLSQGNIPHWVVEHHYPSDPPVQPSQKNTQRLLCDIQKNWEEKAAYYHFAKKALTKAGLGKIGQVRVHFDPIYEKVVFHSIDIIRDGKKHQRLDTSRYHILRRESGLDDNIINGSLTLVYFIEDVRVGDILDYSFTVIGVNPLFSEHFTDRFYLQDSEPIEKQFFRILIRPDHTLYFQPFNTAIEPIIRDISFSLREYTIEPPLLPVPPDEPKQPSWYNPYPRIQVSEYPSWGEVLKTILPLYTLPDDCSHISPEIVQQVTHWKATTQDRHQLAVLAIRFVQDEIRYLGFEEGLNSHKPTTPSIVFQRRFGDCKDKTMLLNTLLALMDIPSTPTLVNSTYGSRLPQFLPNPQAFNHIVLQIQLDDTTYWIDSTLSLQGGSLETTFFPEYHWGLPLSPQATQLIPLPKLTIVNPPEVTSTFTCAKPDTIDLIVTSCLQGKSADSLRRRIDVVGVSKLSEDYANYYHKKYRGCYVSAPIIIADDRAQNTITTTEFYRIPARVRQGHNYLKIYSTIIDDYLDMDIHPERTSPYSLQYPFWFKEKIVIYNPFQTSFLAPQELYFEHESLQLSYSLTPRDGSTEVTIEMKHLKDHVPTTSIHDYWTLVNEIEHLESLDISTN